jgi:hypothetical protein
LSFSLFFLLALPPTELLTPEHASHGLAQGRG